MSQKNIWKAQEDLEFLISVPSFHGPQYLEKERFDFSATWKKGPRHAGRTFCAGDPSGGEWTGICATWATFLPAIVIVVSVTYVWTMLLDFASRAREAAGEPGAGEPGAEEETRRRGRRRREGRGEEEKREERRRRGGLGEKRREAEAGERRKEKREKRKEKGERRRKRQRERREKEKEKRGTRRKEERRERIGQRGRRGQG